MLTERADRSVQGDLVLIQVCFCSVNPCPPKLVDTALFLLLECEPTSPNGPAAMLTTAKNPSAEGLFSLSVMLVCKVLGL